MVQRTAAEPLDEKRETPAVPSQMKAAVYRGRDRIVLETVPVPEVGERELLVRVGACGVCGTDIKKVKHGLVGPPRIFGHETAGTVVFAGRSVQKFSPGDRVALHHHIPCGDCFYCQRRLFSQCPSYLRVGTTAGFEPAGGGFAQYVRVMEWIVDEGTVRIPDHISFEEASFLEPVNTCLKALEAAAVARGEVVVILGQGPVGLLLLQAAVCEGATVLGLDLMDARLKVARRLGAHFALNPRRDDVHSAIAGSTDGRGADVAIVATDDPRAISDAQVMVRRGGRVLLFAQTVPGEMISVDASRICVEEKKLIGSYSASVALQDKAASLLFSRKIRVADLVTHRFGLDQFSEALELASHPAADSLKVMIEP